MTIVEARPDATTPRVFDHDLDPELFTSDRIDWLTREAAKRDRLGVQWADPGRTRFGNDPIHTTPRYPVLEDAKKRPVQYRIYNAAEWGPKEYREAKERIIEQHKPEGADVAVVDSVVRVFAPHAVVALHGDPDLKLICDVSGTTIWYVRPADELTQAQHENLLRGEFFIPFTESENEIALEIPPGRGCFVPARWPHWLDHPSDDPIVSFELGFWSTQSIRDRKVHDVNWLLRRVTLSKVSPLPPGGPNDARKRQFFDTLSTLTRKGTRYRGV